MSNAATRLEDCYREHAAHVLAYLRRMFRDPHAAEDLLQETFVQAARRPERVAAAVSPRAWLLAIARNLAVTALRRKRPTQALPADVPAIEAAEDPRLAAVRRAISDLPTPLRETLELRLRHELTYEEIAAVLAVPIGTVRSRLHHALRRLRAAVVGGED